MADWMLLDRFVFRRDDAESFPDDHAAPFRASSTTSQGSRFSVALRIAKPPATSRFYVQWPLGPNTKEWVNCNLVTVHRDMILFRLTDIVKVDVPPGKAYSLDHFICRASSSSPQLLLKRLPECTIPIVIRVKKCKEITTRRPFHINGVSLLCHGEEEFAVAQLDRISEIPGSRMMEAELSVLRTRVSDDDCKWEIKKVPVHHGKDEFLDLFYWSTSGVITFNNCMCWFDYYRGGILFFEVFEERPKISHLQLPINNRPCNASQTGAYLEMYRTVCVTGGGLVLKFVDVVRNDGLLFGPFDPDSGFTITSHTLNTTEMKWDKDVVITSNELWALNNPVCLPHDILTFPVVSMDKPHVVYFLLSEPWGDEVDKISVVTVDMNTKRVVSVVPYIGGEQDLCGKDADMLMDKYYNLRCFLPSEFPKFLNFTRKRKNQG